MTHQPDTYQDAPLSQEQGEPPHPLSTSGSLDDTPFAQAPQAANENASPRMTPASDAFDSSADESFRIAPVEKLEDLQQFYAAGTEACETIAQAMRTSLEEFAAGMGQLNNKLLEFGRVNAQNNMAFMQNVAGVRNVRDAVDVQTAYMRGQYDAAATQLRELQALSTEIAEKAAAPFKQQMIRSTQMFRSC
jgi:hypothetical protein